MSKRKPQFDFWTIVTIGILAVFALFLIYPLISLFVDGFLEEGTGAFTMANFTKFFGKKFYYRSLLNSLKLTVCVTICSLLIGVPLAYIMSFFKIRGKSIIEILIIISMMSPNFIGAYSWITLLGRSGIIHGTDALQAHLADLREGVAFPAGAADLLCIIILFAFPGGGLGVLGDRKRYVRLDGAQLAVQVGKGNDLGIRKKAFILLIERIFLKMGAAKFAVACTLV